MKKNFVRFNLVAVFTLLFVLVACSNKTETVSSESGKTQTLSYLNKEYKVPAQVKNIVTASLESMEDAAVLGVKPVGSITVGGKLPSYLAKELDGAKSIGEKQQPNYEALLTLKPDVIMGTSKFQPDVVEKLNKIAPMLPVSHISTNWEANLKLMGELTKNKEKADQVISKYKEDAAKLKESLQPMKDKKAVIIRIRGGNINLYPSNIYFNPVLYNDLGLTVPKELQSLKAQEVVSLEKFAEINPDYIFVQFAESENADKKQALEELQKNPIWNTIQAVKNKKVYVNTVDPMAQGGTAWSKIAFLKAAEQMKK
ncbi:iron complex transport system substrate-binding protein [Croceifilum oryzae]|uniref:Iron complex transport system substrate-binding protein n=1 Tax=Croceifilum oryzae TaxID=1553429 RepID=A0AAJ1TK91_9BACL|nr:iron complex transport system substrate-binding protein [Croceifilum oryzae]